MAADAVFTTLEACVEQVEQWVSPPSSGAHTPPILPDREQEQLAVLRALGLASARDRRFDEVSRKVAQHFDAAGEVLVSENVAEDERFANDPLVLEKGIRFYAGAPLRTPSGLIIGSLSVIDTQPREFSDADRQSLQKRADELVAELEGRAKAGLGNA
jgi:GAF domain-containing protein